MWPRETQVDHYHKSHYDDDTEDDDEDDDDNVTFHCVAEGNPGYSLDLVRFPASLALGWVGDPD